MKLFRISLDFLNDERVVGSIAYDRTGSGFPCLFFRILIPGIHLGKKIGIRQETSVRFSFPSVFWVWHEPGVDVGFSIGLLGFGFGVAYQWGY